MKQNNLEFAQEMRDMLTSIEAIKGPQYAAIIESALNQANSAVGWSILADDKLPDEVMKMFVICDNIINVNVSLMVSLWQTSNLKLLDAEGERLVYEKCQQLGKDIQADIKMLQAKQREYSSIAS